MERNLEERDTGVCKIDAVETDLGRMCDIYGCPDIAEVEIKLGVRVGYGNSLTLTRLCSGHIRELKLGINALVWWDGSVHPR